MLPYEHESWHLLYRATQPFVFGLISKYIVVETFVWQCVHVQDYQSTIHVPLRAVVCKSSTYITPKQVKCHYSLLAGHIWQQHPQIRARLFVDAS